MHKTLYIFFLSFLIFSFPGYSAETASHHGFRFKKEALYWTTHEEGLAYTNKPSNILITSDFTKTSRVQPNFHWEYGFRLQAGYTLCSQPWTFKVSWAHIDSKATGRQAVNSGTPDFQGMFPIWSMSKDTLVGDYVSSSSMRWYLHTNLIDLDALYWFPVDAHLSIYPQIGLRCAILNQKLHTQYSGGTFFNGVDNNIMRNRFLGIGPRFGATSYLPLKYGFSLYNLLAFTPMYGHFDLSHREFYLEGKRFSNLARREHLVLSFDYHIGIQWEGTVITSWPNLSVRLSWEGHNFYHQNLMHRNTYGFFKKNRNLILYGWALSTGLNF